MLGSVQFDTAILTVLLLIALSLSFSHLSSFIVCRSTPSEGTSSIASDGPAPEKDFGRSNRRGPAPKAGFRPGGKTTNDSDDKARTKRKTSLRITSGRRGSELTQRRGSLRKRDRTAQREAKLEAALERRTVYLPEYVCCLLLD